MASSKEPTICQPLFPARLLGERIELVDLAEDGLADMAEYSRNPRLYDHLEFSPHLTIEDTSRYLDRLRKRSESSSAHYWFIRLRATSRVIGTFGVTEVDQRVGRAEIGYGLDPTMWGNGYFSETLAIALRFLFRDAGFHRVAARTAITNERSIRGLERNGFRREGVMRNYYLMCDGRRLDAVFLSILAFEWEPTS